MVDMLLTVTSQWRTHQIKPATMPNDKNYKLMNKMAAKSRIYTSDQQSVFRQSQNHLRISDPASKQ